MKRENNLMGLVWMLLAAIAAILGVICAIVILIDAFQDEIWKGVACLLCGFYFLWYSIFDFEHDNKWPIVIGALGGSGIAAGLMRMAGQ